MILFFAGFLKIIAPGGGDLTRFFCPRGRDFALSLCPGGWGICSFKKFPGALPRRGGGGGGWSGLELTDTLWLSMTTERTSGFHRPIARRPVMLLGACCLVLSLQTSARSRIIGNIAGALTAQ